MDRLANYCQAVILHSPRASGTEPPLPWGPYGASGNALHTDNMRVWRGFVNHPFLKGGGGGPAGPAGRRRRDLAAAVQGAGGGGTMVCAGRPRADWRRDTRSPSACRGRTAHHRPMRHRGAGFWAIEVKNGRSPRLADLRGIKTFHRDYLEATPLLLYRGSESLMRDGVRCMPVDRFLRELVPGQELPS